MQFKHLSYVLVLAFACLSLLSLVVGARPALANVVISELFWMGSDLSTQDEWIELAGVQTPTNVSNWTLTSQNTSGNEIIITRFASGTVIGSGDYLIVSRFPAANSRLATEPHILSSTMTLPNTKLLVRLRNASGVVMDSADDGAGEPFAGTNTATAKASMERVNPFGLGSDHGSWMTALQSLGFDTGAIPLFGTPGFSFLGIPTTDIDPPLPVTNLTGSLLQTGTGFLLRASWTPSASADVDEQQTTVRPMTGSAVTLVLPKTATGFSLTLPTVGTGVLLSVTSVDQSGNISPDSKIVIQPYGITNNNEQKFVSISEVLPNPFGSDDTEWIELLNTGTGSVSLQGLQLKTSGGTQRYSFNATDVLAPGSYLFLPKTVTTLSLPNTSGTVQLLRGTDVLDSMSYPSLPEGVSFGRDADEEGPFCMPTPGAEADEASWLPSVSLQSGSLQGQGSVSLNLIITTPSDMVPATSCNIDFGDGDVSNSCNPPSHTYGDVGDYDLIIDATNYCSTTVQQQLLVEVEPVPQSSSSSSTQSHSSSSRQSSASSLRSSSSSSVPVLAHKNLSMRALPNPAGVDTAAEWIEVVNDGTESIDTAALFVRVNGTKTIQLPASVLRSRQSKRWFTADLHVTLKNTVGSVELLNAPDGSVIDDVFWETAEEDAVYPLEIEKNEKVILTSSVLQEEEKEEQIIDTNYPDLIVSEVYPYPLKDAEEEYQAKEWIEIFNPTNKQVVLDGWKVKDASKAAEKGKLVPKGLMIQPMDFVVIFSEDVSLSLNNDTDTVTLLSPAGVAIDTFTYAKVKVGQSAARVATEDVELKECVTDEPTPERTNVCNEAPVATVAKTTTSKSSKKSTSSSALKITYKNILSETGSEQGSDYDMYAGMVMGGDDVEPSSNSGALGIQIVLFLIGIGGGALIMRYYKWILEQGRLVLAQLHQKKI